MIMFNHYYTISHLPFDSQQSCCRRGEYIICIGFILSTCVCGLLFVWTVSCELFLLLQPVLVWWYTIRARVTCIEMWLLWSRSQCSNYHSDDFILLWFTSPTSDVCVCTYYIVRAEKLLWWFTFCVCLPPLTSIPQVDAMIFQVAAAGWQERTARSELGFENRGFCAAFRDFHVAFLVLPADGRDWPHTGTAPIASSDLCMVPGWQIPKTGWPE